MAKSSQDTRNNMLKWIESHPGLSSMEVHQNSGLSGSYATTKRIIAQLISEGFLLSKGQGKATRYFLSEKYSLLSSIDPEIYFQAEIDERKIRSDFNMELLKDTLKKVPVFSKQDLSFLNELQELYNRNISSLSPVAYNKELERLAIDLSWKSSQIEGNTYSLLETERLLREKQTAAGKTRDEATMLLNHKEALDFIIQHPDFVSPLTVSRIEDIHSILVRDLQVERNLRKRRVGISGTNYKPLDNEFQIKEAMMAMCDLINTEGSVFSKSLLALVLISYIQPFADGNKRTARIVSNAILMNNGYCPLSFRTVDSVFYKKAMLIFYEKNNISAFKKLYMEQFEFAVKTYF